MNITMEGLNKFSLKELYAIFVDFLRIFIFRVISVGPIPAHIAFIMDGNRRYARRNNLKEGVGHRIGYSTLMSVVKYCQQLGVKYVTVFAFAIDNFKRPPDEVKTIMELLEEKALEMIDGQSSVHRDGVKVCFLGNLKLLNESTRIAAEKAMEATAKNDKIVLFICVAYSFTDEIVHAAREARREKQTRTNGLNSAITLADIERQMYLAGVPDPDILVRTSGETRLSNFLLWQTTHSNLYSPAVLWPGINMWTISWMILNYQRAQPYLDKTKKLA